MKLKIVKVFDINARGFTLIELVFSITLLALIVVIITSAIRISLHSVDKGEKLIDSNERLRTSINLINSQIQSQIPLTFVDDGEEKSFFEGDSESLQFATNYSIWNAQKGYVVVKYNVEPDANGDYILAVSENVIGLDIERDTILFHDIDTLNFEYYFKDPTEETGEWFEEWRDTLDIPEKVKLNLISGENDFSMIIPTRTVAYHYRTINQKGSAPWVDIKKLSSLDYNR